MNRQTRYSLAASFSAILMAPAVFAQIAPAPPLSLPRTPSATGGATLTPGAPASPVAASMLDQSAVPAAINFVSGKLTIQATNSSLRAILHDIESRTGTKVEGLSRDERIFGVYGPGNPQEVLAALLDDSGYNVLISGRKDDGSPREVVLSARNASATPPPAPGAGRTQSSDEDDDSEGGATPPAPQPALFAPPQQQGNPASPSSQPGSTAPAVRTPQQMLEELQRIRQGSTPQGTPQGGYPQGTPPQ